MSLTTLSRIKSLSSLTMGGFSIGMTEYLMMGLLPEVANSLNVSIPKAGYLISIYAFGVVIGAPLMIGLTNKLSAKRLLVWLMFLFFVFHAIFSLAPNYPLLLITRFLAGLPHGAFFGIGAVIATHLAKPGKGASAVAVMFLGLTLANCFGVPLGTYIGHHYSWRLAYFIVSLCGLLTFCIILKWLPDIPINTKNNYLESFKIFKNTRIWLIIGISAIGTGGTFAWLSYIAPFMIEVIAFPSSMITFIMMSAGFGMIIGNVIGGRLTDKSSPLAITAVLLVIMMICLQIIALNTDKILAVAMTFITGIVAFAFVPTVQILMINAAKGSEMLASSMIQATANLGNTLGAFLGGLPIAAGFGFASAQYIGIALAFFGLIFCLLIMLNQNYPLQLFPKNEQPSYE